jgi:hypothetical protein
MEVPFILEQDFMVYMLLLELYASLSLVVKEGGGVIWHQEYLAYLLV